MKIVAASTEEQEKHIEELIQQMYTEVFSIYLSNHQVKERYEITIPKLSEASHYYGTLKEAFQIISSLQTLIALMEHLNGTKNIEKYKKMYERNVRTLEYYGLQFPLSFDELVKVTSTEDLIPRHMKPANQWLI